MALFNDTLFSMRGKVRRFRPLATATLVDGWINDRIREVLDRRILWVDLVVFGNMSIPAAYSTGTVAVTTGSTIATGSGTAWPVADAVNTTIAAGVTETGAPSEVYPVSMTGITPGTLLYADSAGAHPEIVAVLATSNQASFTARFQYAHNASCTLTASSLAGRQFRLGANCPTFTVRAIASATQMLLDMAWGGDPVSGSAYLIVKMYLSFPGDLRDLVAFVDPQQGLPLRTHISLAEANARDPQRGDSGNPVGLVDLKPDEGGNMQYELWPRQETAYQFPYVYVRQWPELVNDTDRPPWFINPTIFVDGAIAEALRYKAGKDDPFHNPALAREYEARFAQGYENAKNADEAKLLQSLEQDPRLMAGLGANYWQSHDQDVNAWAM